MFRKYILIVIFFGVISHSAYAEILPVIDTANLPENIMTAVNSYNEVAKSILILEQMKKDYETTIKNTLAPGFWVWDKAINFDDNVEKLQKQFEDLANGGLEDYLKRYLDVDFYRNSPCFRLGGCSDDEIAKIKEYQRKRLEQMSKDSKIAAKAIGRYLEITEQRKKALYQLHNEMEKTNGINESISYTNQMLVMIYEVLLDMNSSLKMMQKQMISESDVKYDEKATEFELIKNNNSRKLTSKVKGLSPEYRYLRLR